jgi:CheY-like chemotaxis protein
MHFYDHYIINELVKDPILSENTLLDLYVEPAKHNSLYSLRKLIHDGHLREDNGFYVLRTYSVSTILNGVCIDKLNLSYKLCAELERELGIMRAQIESDEEENDLDFHLLILGVKIEKEQQGFIETWSGRKLELDSYEYYLTAEYVNLRDRGVDNNYANRLVVHLDDHPLFANKLKDKIRDSYLPGSEWVHFTHPSEAINFIQARLASEKPVDLVITDINHPGLNGYEFAKIVKMLQDDYHSFRIPVIALSVVGYDNYLIQQGITEQLFQKAFSKGDDTRVIGNYLKDML